MTTTLTIFSTRGAITLPFNYPQRLVTSLHPYLSPPVDPVAYELAWQMLASGDGSVLTFLNALNIYRTCQHQIRQTSALGLPVSLGQNKWVPVGIRQSCLSMPVGLRA